MNIVQRVPVTKAGIEQMRQELSRMKKVDRPAIVLAIATARALGDLKENAEYHAAKEQQGLLEAKISQLEDQVSRSQVIDLSTMTNDGRVVFGSTISLENQENEKKVQFTIVGQFEADLSQNKLSIISPMARAVIGKMLGDIVAVKTPAGLVEYEILSVDY